MSRRWVRGVAAVLAAALVVSGVDVVTQRADTGPRAAAADTPPAQPEVTSRPDAVSAALSARLSGHRVLVTNALTDTVSTYANPDGSFTSDTATGPVRCGSVKTGTGKTSTPRWVSTVPA